MRSDTDRDSGIVYRELRRARAVYRRFGMKSAVQKALMYPVRVVKADAKYWMHRNTYPTNVIFIASQAKSGSTWLAEMLASLPGFSRYQPERWTSSFLDDVGQGNQDVYGGMFREVKRRLAVIKGHTPGTAENVLRLGEAGQKYLITVRDPRDQLISGYWYLRNRPHHLAHPLAMRLSLDEFIEHELDPSTALVPRMDWLRTWLANRDTSHSRIVRYEDLLLDTQGEMRRVLEFLEMPTKQETLSRIVAANRFVAASGREAGVEDRSSFRRRGVAGEWKEVFASRHRLLARENIEDLLEALGYEPTTV